MHVSGVYARARFTINHSGSLPGKTLDIIPRASLTFNPLAFGGTNNAAKILTTAAAAPTAKVH